MTKLFNGNHLDLYSINSDFTGSRYFTIDQEEVEFHNAILYASGSMNNRRTSLPTGIPPWKF